VVEVGGPGKLVPESIRWVAATTAGRVERIGFRGGMAVEESTVLLELANQDLELRALEAQARVAGARAERVNLEAELRLARLNHDAIIKSVETDYNDARRRMRAHDLLRAEGLISDLEMEQSRGKVAELGARLDIETECVGVRSEVREAQLEELALKVERLQAVADFCSRQVESLRVRAGSAGILQEVTVETGQWVEPGTLLAKVVEPERLKAALRVPETEARDIQAGQPARIDTRNGEVSGSVLRVHPTAREGAVLVDVELEGALPRGARPDLTVTGKIEVARIAETLYTPCPAHARAHSTLGLFRLEDDGRHAVFVPVKLGALSVKSAEVLAGLEEGDEVIVSDLRRYETHPRIRVR
jgi:multidrug resistance efflux pump